MSSRSFSYRARRIHRYLGVFIGIQFVLWTAGGLYFSWTDLDEIHGDHLRAATPTVLGDAALASPAAAIAQLRALHPVDSLAGLELLNVHSRPTYRLHFFTRDGERTVRRTRLADAATGNLREPVSREEAIVAARSAMRADLRLAGATLVTEENVNGHHEYRGGSLPAWAVSFEGPERVTAYVPVDLGRVERVRNDRWRVFDLLWMLHTMDYRGRDDINNAILRALSVLGLATILSGFTLFALTARPLRRMLTRRRVAAARVRAEAA